MAGSRDVASLQALISKRFGRLTVVGLPARQEGKSRAVCLCDCGEERLVVVANLRSGNTVSCGCVHREGVSTTLKRPPAVAQPKKPKSSGESHSYSRSPTYQVWSNMWTRCTNPTHDRYDAYGGRGITVDLAWKDFTVFLRDMGEKPDGMSIDRLDNDLGYSRANCRWATEAQQKSNTQKTEYVTLRGERVTASEACRRLGQSRGWLYAWKRLRGFDDYQTALDAWLAKNEGGA